MIHDELTGEPEWMRCEHAWVYSTQSDMPHGFSVGRCMFCGHLNGPDILRQVEEIADDAKRGLRKQVVANIRLRRNSVSNSWLADDWYSGMTDAIRIVHGTES